MSINPSETNAVSELALEKKFTKNLSLKDSSDLKDEKQKNTVSETKSEAVVDTEFTSKPVRNNEFVEGDLEEFVERLGIKGFTENKDEWKKFYVVFGPDFVWPPTTKLGERREVFDYIIRPRMGTYRGGTCKKYSRISSPTYVQNS